MYTVYLINNGKKINVFSAKSQKELDEFTTSFKSSEELISKLGLDDTYKVSVERKYKGKDINLSFQTTDKRGLLYCKDIKEYYIDTLEKYNIEDIKNYFYEDYSTYDEDTEVSYLKHELKNLKEVLLVLNDEKVGVSFKASIIKKYFQGNSMYGNFKHFYLQFPSSEKFALLKEDEEAKNKYLRETKAKLEQGKLKIDFIRYEMIENNHNESVLNYFLDRDLDIDKKMDLIDLYLEDEKKEDYIKKNISRL